jgi:MoaA/NifB/PqqE/SkfB family radical SAM enzyme
MHKVISKWPHQDSIRVEWNMGKRCNLDCGYCPAEIHDNFSPHTPLQTFKDAIDKLVEIGKPIRLSFTGGEPCVHPNIKEILSYARDKVDWINITTNGTLPYKFYLSLPVNHYVFSIHFDNKMVTQVINNVLIWAQSNEVDNLPFQLNIMAHHEYMDEVRHATTVFDGHNIPYVIRRIRWTEADNRDWFDDMRYDPKDLEWILNQASTVKPNVIIDDKEEMHANDVIKHKLNQFEGWECNAGIESLMINWDGDVHRATCRVGGSLGNIYKGTFEHPSQAVICTRKWCTCAADIPLTKVNEPAQEILPLRLIHE